MNIVITTKVTVWLGNVLGGRLQSAEDERGRLVRAVMAGVGGSDGE